MAYTNGMVGWAFDDPKPEASWDRGDEFKEKWYPYLLPMYEAAQAEINDYESMDWLINAMTAIAIAISVKAKQAYNDAEDK